MAALGGARLAHTGVPPDVEDPDVPEPVPEPESWVAGSAGLLGACEVGRVVVGLVDGRDGGWDESSDGCWDGCCDLGGDGWCVGREAEDAVFDADWPPGRGAVLADGVLAGAAVCDFGC